MCQAQTQGCSPLNSSDFGLPAHEINHNYDTIVRLRPDATMEALRAAAATKMAALAQQEPGGVGRAYVIRPLVADMVGDLRTTLLLVLGATLLLLLLAAVNVTTLLLARGTTRSREMAVRSALGASRWHVLQQAPLESLVIATNGTAAGRLLALGAVRMMLRLGASRLPRLDAVPFDGRVLLFAVLVLACSAMMMRIAPAWRLSRVDITTLLNGSSRSTTRSRETSRTRAALIVAEVVLALMLVAGSGWLVQSFARLRASDPRFEPQGRLVVDVRGTRPFRGQADAHAWEDGLVDSVRAAAPSAVVGAAATFPFRRDRDATLLIHVDGQPEDPNSQKGARAAFAATAIPALTTCRVDPSRALRSE